MILQDLLKKTTIQSKSTQKSIFYESNALYYQSQYSGSMQLSEEIIQTHKA